MNYMLDTDTFSYIMRYNVLSVVKTLDEKMRTGHVVCISVITYQELRFGAERRGSAKYHNLIDAICDRLDYIAEWNATCADRFAIVQSSLLKKGAPIGYTDAMIASHAISLDATLVTNNYKHFSNVDGLSLDNWVAA